MELKPTCSSGKLSFQERQTQIYSVVIRRSGILIFWLLLIIISKSPGVSYNRLLQKGPLHTRVFSLVSLPGFIFNFSEPTNAKKHPIFMIIWKYLCQWYSDNLQGSVKAILNPLNDIPAWFPPTSYTVYQTVWSLSDGIQVATELKCFFL